VASLKIYKTDRAQPTRGITAKETTMIYAAKEKGKGQTTKVLLVAGLIHELKKLPQDAVALISGDEEGNTMGFISTVELYEDGGGDLHGFVHTDVPTVVLFPNH
jgi:hypothetical protein